MLYAGGFFKSAAYTYFAKPAPNKVYASKTETSKTQQAQDKPKQEKVLTEQEKFALKEALFAAIYNGNLEKVKDALGKDAEITDNSIETAINLRRTDILKLMMGKDNKVAEKALVYAFDKGNKDLIGYVLRLMPDLDEEAANNDKIKSLLDKEKEPAVKNAVKGNYKPLQFLIDNGVKNFSPYICDATEEVLKYIFKRGVPYPCPVYYMSDKAKMDLLLSKGGTPAISSSNSVKEAQYMLTKGAKPFLCNISSLELFQFMYAKGAGLSGREECNVGTDCDGGACMGSLLNHYAGVNGNLNIVKFLTKEGIKTDYKTLHYAVINGNTEIIKYLFPNHNLDVQDKDGNTELIRAANDGNKEKVDALLRSGANPDIQNNIEFTALISAASNGYKEIAGMLLKAGANPDMQTDVGNTALIYAAGKAHKEIVEMLLKAGANPDLQNNWGGTALIDAADHNHKEIVAMLLKAGANRDLKDRQGRTALMKVTQAGNKEIADMLKAGSSQDIQDDWDNNALIDDNDDNYEDIIAIEKAHASEALSIMQTIKQSEERYYLIHGRYTMDFDDLDISIAGTKIARNEIAGEYFKYVLVHYYGSNIYLDAYRMNSSYGYWFDYIFDHSNYQGYLEGGKLYCSAREKKDEEICAMLGTFRYGGRDKRYEILKN
jgi:ankyrin repeat protein